MNEIEVEVTPHPPLRSRRVVTAVVVLAFALVLGGVALVAGRPWHDRAAAPLAPLPAPAGGSTAGRFARPRRQPAIAQPAMVQAAYRLGGHAAGPCPSRQCLPARCRP